MDGSDMNWASLWHRQANKYEIFVFVFFFSKYLFGLMSVRLWTLHLNLRREQGNAFVDSKLVVQRCLDSFQYEALFVMSSREMIANSIHSRLVRDNIIELNWNPTHLSSSSVFLYVLKNLKNIEGIGCLYLW